MKCEHINKSLDKISNLVRKINNSDPSVCEEISYIPKYKLLNFLDGLRNIRDEAEREKAFHFSFFLEAVLGARVINIDGFNDSLKEIFNELNDCDCYSNVSSTKSDLNFYKTNYFDLQDKHGRVERELRNLRGEKEDIIKDLREKLGQEERGRKNEKTEYHNKELEREREKRERDTKIARLEEKSRNDDNQIQAKENQIGRLELQLDQRRVEMRTLKIS